MRCTGDHVELVTSLEHRRIRGVTDGRTNEPSHYSRLRDDRLRIVGIELDAEHVADFAEERLDRLRPSYGEPMPAQSSNPFGERRDGVVVVDHAAVAGTPARGEFDPGHAFLGALDRVETSAADSPRKAADFTDPFGDAFEEFGMMVDKPPRA